MQDLNQRQAIGGYANKTASYAKAGRILRLIF
jgi:hypothetical protein